LPGALGSYYSHSEFRNRSSTTLYAKEENTMINNDTIKLLVSKNLLKSRDEHYHLQELFLEGAAAR